MPKNKPRTRVDENGTFLVECDLCGKVDAYATFALFDDGTKMPIWRCSQIKGEDSDYVATPDNLVVPGRDNLFIQSCNSRAVGWEDSMGKKEE